LAAGGVSPIAIIATVDRSRLTTERRG
jgi:hypothetical protein